MTMSLSEFIFNHWELFVSLAILCLLLFIYEIRTYRDASSLLSPQEAVLLMNQKAVIFDLRPETEFHLSHIVNAKSVKENEFESKLLSKYKKQPIILLCQNGLQSAQAASAWQKAGYEHVKVLKGGIDYWKEAGFPLITDSNKK